MGFPSCCTVFYIFIINVYIIIYITKLKYPLLAFGVREGRGGHCHPEKNTRTPHLHFNSCLEQGRGWGDMARMWPHHWPHSQGSTHDPPQSSGS
jgi:hypothetical protein